MISKTILFVILNVFNPPYGFTETKITLKTFEGIGSDIRCLKEADTIKVKAQTAIKDLEDIGVSSSFKFICESPTW